MAFECVAGRDPIFMNRIITQIFDTPDLKLCIASITFNRRSFVTEIVARETIDPHAHVFEPDHLLKTQEHFDAFFEERRCIISNVIQDCTRWYHRDRHIDTDRMDAFTFSLKKFTGQPNMPKVRKVMEEAFMKELKELL